MSQAIQNKDKFSRLHGHFMAKVVGLFIASRSPLQGWKDQPMIPELALDGRINPSVAVFPGKTMSESPSP